MKTDKKPTLHFYSDIYKNFDKLKGTGVIPDERLDSAIEWVKDENFVPVKLEDGHEIKNWVCHKPSGKVFPHFDSESSKHYIYDRIFEDFFNESEIKALNENANKIWNEINDNFRFQKAEKITWKENGSDCICDDNNYFNDPDDFIEQVLENCDVYDFESFLAEVPKFVWTTKITSYLTTIDAKGHLQDVICSDVNVEDGDPEFIGWDELQNAINKFIKANEDQCYYMVDYSKAIILDEQFWRKIYNELVADSV